MRERGRMGEREREGRDRERQIETDRKPTSQTDRQTKDKLFV